MKKNIGKFKQWTGEKLGSSHKTETTYEFKELQQKADARNNGYEKILTTTNSYLKTIGKKKTSFDDRSRSLPIESLGAAMRVFGEELGSDSEFGVALVKFGIANEKIASAQLEYLTRVKDEFLDGVNAVTADIKLYQALKKKLESRRLDYDAKQNRVQKSKKEKPELEEEMQAAKQKYEETLEDLENKINTIFEHEEHSVKDVSSFLDAQFEFFKRGYEILAEVKEDWVEVNSGTTSRRPLISRRSTRDSRTSRDDTEDQLSDDDTRSYSNDSRSKKAGTSRSSGTVSKPKSLKSNVSNKPTRSLSPSSYSKDSSSSSGAKKVKAIYEFEASGDDELTIAVDDVITVTEEIDEGWWNGEITDPDGTVRSGMFPANYTTEINEPISNRRTPTISRQSYDDSENEESIDTVRSRHVPPVPSRQSKPPPSKSSRSAPAPRPVMTRGSSASSTSSAQRTSYLPDFSNDHGSSNVGPCQECGCDDYAANVFKKGSCNNCFHKH
ncbi:4229_t:CDS:2 [Paraglomus brasilianum]|uniref:4229_t:CDS:1 n=1 Tax=Paraglomus brasilianum TaxID=144538 RepID=A0A9N8Z6P9_9GLOM|nr:4229_t:CDS:2 [Paraglomus brasilianum]